MVRFADFEMTASGEKADVVTQLSSEHQRQAEENMTRLRSVIPTVMFLGRQNMPLRGHRHEASKDRRGLSRNPGNFMALMNFRAEAGYAHATGSFYQARCGKSVTYCGSRIQNDVIQCCGGEIRDSLVKAINQSPFFAILADEASYCSNKEQMPLVVRYVADTGICEDFLGFVLCDSGTSGTALAKLILQKLGEWWLNLERLRGQGYDGAGNMAGRLSGCSAIIRQSYPKALYVHCSSHCLNVYVVAGTKITPVSSMWSILLEVSIFFKYSPKRQAKLESVITANNEGATVRKLVDLCKTRWVARRTALITFKALYVVTTFKVISRGARAEWNTESQSAASSLLRSITSFECIMAFIVTGRVMAPLHSLTIALQSSSLDIIRAYHQIQSVHEVVSECRTEEQHEAWFDEAVAFADMVRQA